MCVCIVLFLNLDLIKILQKIVVKASIELFTNWVKKLSSPKKLHNNNRNVIFVCIDLFICSTLQFTSTVFIKCDFQA